MARIAPPDNEEGVTRLIRLLPDTSKTLTEIMYSSDKAARVCKYALLGTATGDISNDFIYNAFGLVYDKIDVTFTAVQKGETVEFAFETKANGNDQGLYVLLCCSKACAQCKSAAGCILHYRKALPHSATYPGQLLAALNTVNVVS